MDSAISELGLHIDFSFSSVLSVRNAFSSVNFKVNLEVVSLLLELKKILGSQGLTGQRSVFLTDSMFCSSVLKDCSRIPKRENISLLGSVQDGS